MSPEGHHIRRAIHRHTVRRNTREVLVLIAGIYGLCALVAWVVFT